LLRAKEKEYRQGHAMAPEIGKWKRKQSIFEDDGGEDIYQSMVCGKGNI
jgi:hypothetical protein